ncbi:heme-binding protein [Thiocystis minor]|uniref:SOUL family heme-binding protein n=1 Tax=Thiocystis minor TaxID=61597 RepID=UPI0019138B0C|nr:heme-binding protein [Thiocystis minor]MBK5966886.1 heme-binding protein [Thiocystis minor]
MASEEPAYETIRQGPDVELRRYRPSLLAETQVSGEFDAVGGTAFRILADDIFANNQARESIAMTALVSQRLADGTEPGSGTRIEMTAPVTQQLTDPTRGTDVISFLMPARFTLATLPRPNDSRVMLREEPARLLAVLRDSGSWAEPRDREHEARRLAAVRAAGLTPLGDHLYARYHSPFSLPFLRRNEVMVEVAEPGLP